MPFDKMTGWAEELDSANQLAEGAVSRLQEIDPANELLWFWIKPPEGQDPFGGDEEKCRTAMKDRFWEGEGRPPWQEVAGSIVTTIVTGNYYLAVEEEIKRLTVRREREI